ncbi:hypothetical protein FGO68_gene11409 [Halteria grandinella]|uniref:N6-adenine methyltransferase n=1 Tax=Halteria grandinella TaxID=5974 RepID=A0A8J8T0Q2_HALGN|nr:hypothetical protein FGO68_gene11409 [Halteria grandinella]
MDSLNPFLAKHKEKSDFNQYWYSKATINFMASECEQFGQKIAFLSTPSIYFSLKNKEIKAASRVFDFDTKFNKDPGFVFYDFNKPEDIPADLHSYFDMVVIDPPFITREVWEKYATAAKLILIKEGGKILLSTIDENEGFIDELLGAKRRAFRPSIPNLVYQYSLYSNYESEGLLAKNPEIPDFD